MSITDFGSEEQSVASRLAAVFSLNHNVKNGADVKERTTPGSVVVQFPDKQHGTEQASKFNDGLNGLFGDHVRAERLSPHRVEVTFTGSEPRQVFSSPKKVMEFSDLAR